MSAFSTTVNDVVDEINCMNLQDRAIIALDCAMEINNMFIGRHKSLYIPIVYIHTKVDEHPRSFKFEVISHNMFKELDIVNGVYVTATLQTLQDIIDLYCKSSGIFGSNATDLAVVNACAWLLCQRHGDINELYSMLDYRQKRIIRTLEKRILACYNKYGLGVNV